ncbi:ATP-dependent DNA helicase CHL1 [Dictyocoela muelleri]|nr:ATP-dependent DNA helicase CHL1 [Dictyocoela muelleri]
MTLKLYPSQKDFIEKATEVIENEEIGIFSSPTGTGKTISLLYSVLNFDNQIFYTSRTHVQLEQSLRELRRISEVDAVILGSRRIYCINDKINRLEPDIINDKCREMIKSRECQFYTNAEFCSYLDIDQELDDFFEQIRGNAVQNKSNRYDTTVKSFNKINDFENFEIPSLEANKKESSSLLEGHIKNKKLDISNFNFCDSKNSRRFVDIEDFKAVGKKFGFCPYFGVKEISKTAKITFLPYTLLFSKEGRKSAGINTRDAIIVVDEAHNLYNTLISINTAVLSSQEIRRYCVEINRKVNNSKRKSENLKNIDLIILSTIQSILKFMTGKPETAISVNEFLLKLDLYNFNFIEISDHIHSPEIKNFFYLLTYSDDNCLVFYNSDQVKITPMDPSIYLETLDFKSIILAGGTMEPIDQIKTLFNREIKHFTFPSICNNFVSFILTDGPSRRVKLNFECTNDEIIVECLTIVNNLSVTVKNGAILCFLPSKNMLFRFKKQIEKFKFRKNVIFEDETTLDDFKKSRNSILFAVVNGKFSEGTDFKDELCRLLIIIGIPYPTPSLELTYRCRAFPEYSTLMAMTSINQAIGRAIRHKDDFSGIVFLDQRYVFLKKYISPHVKEKTQVKDFPNILKEINQFLKDRTVL